MLLPGRAPLRFLTLCTDRSTPDYMDKSGTAPAPAPTEAPAPAPAAASANPTAATPVAPAGPAGTQPKIGDEADLFRPRPRAQRQRTVTLPDKGDFLVAAVTPFEYAQINQLCIIRTPDPENPGQEKVEWDATKRSFYLIARALRKSDGKRMFADNDPMAPMAQVTRGADMVGGMLTNAEVEILLDAVWDVSGLTGRAQRAAGKK